MTRDSSQATFLNIPIDEVQRYWDARPCNVRHSMCVPGTREYFDEVEARRYFVEPHIPAFAEFSRWQGKRVLEIGCGIGTETINFARAGAQVTAVDLSEKSLQLARRRAEVFGLADRITFYRADAEKLHLVVPPHPYDLVYSFGVIHHTPNPTSVLDEVRRYYVSTGSVLKLMVYHRQSWKVWWILVTYGQGAFWRLDELIARYSEAETGCPVTYAYSRRRLSRMLQSNFNVERMDIRHVFQYRIPDYVKYQYVKEWYFRCMPPWLLSVLERRIGWHLCVTATAR
jgi:2-polyprenyl-3-methyl-5-hydroxy-6-metoxy-1,4-benzoquinol methylase